MKLVKEVKIALSVIVAIIIFVVGINFLKGRALFDNNNTFYGIYDKVDGLKVSSVVTYRGYKVGQVHDIEFIGKSYDKVLVTMVVTNDVQFSTNTVASLYGVDIMGGKGIELEDVRTSDDFLQSGDTLITMYNSDMMEQMEPMVSQIESVVNSLESSLRVVNVLLSDTTNGGVANTLRNVNVAMANFATMSGELNVLLRKERSTISRVLGNVEGLTARLDDAKVGNTLANIESLTGSLVDANLDQMFLSLDSVINGLNIVLENINRGEGTIGSLVKDKELYYNIASLSDNLDELVLEFKQNPKKFVNISVFGSKDKNSKQEPSYGIVLYEGKKRLALSDDLYQEYPNMLELRRNSNYIYVHSLYSDFKSANARLNDIKRKHNKAFVARIS